MPAERRSTIIGPLRSPMGHLAFPWLLQPETTGRFPSNKFVTTFLMKMTENLQELVTGCLKAAQAEWPELNITLATQIKLPLRKGSEKPGWADYVFFKAKSKNRPPAVDASKAPYDGPLTGGSKCRLAVSAMPYKMQLEPELGEALRAQGKIVQVGIIEGRSVSWRPAVTFLLNAVQFFGAHPPIGGTATVDGVGSFEPEVPAVAAASAAAASDLFT